MADYLKEGKVMRKHPIYGVEVISPNDPEMMNMMSEVYQELETDSQNQESMYMNNPEQVEKTIREMFTDDNTDINDEYYNILKVKITKMISVKINDGFRDSFIRFIFDGILNNNTQRIIVESHYYSGSFYEPPDEEHEWDILENILKYLKTRIEEFTTPKPDRGFLDNSKPRINGTATFSPITTQEQYDMEKKRLEHIIRKDINRFNELSKYQGE